MISMRQRFTLFLQRFYWNRTAKDLENVGIQNLAELVLDYVRMRLQLYPNANAMVAVSELAFRFRESQWVVRRALRVLESRRQAEKTSLDDIWKLQI
jgi:hypothetical protein